MKSSISVGQMVHVRNFGHGAIWLDGEIVGQTGPLSFMVQLHDGRVLRRHTDHLRTRTSQSNVPQENIGPDIITSDTVPDEIPSPSSDDEHTKQHAMQSTAEPIVSTTVSSPQVNIHTPVPLRRSTRIVKPPDVLDL